jgi:hypothetical protein
MVALEHSVTPRAVHYIFLCNITKQEEEEEEMILAPIVNYNDSF